MLAEAMRAAFHYDGEGFVQFLRSLRSDEEPPVAAAVVVQDNWAALKRKGRG